ncbi:Uncharacterised protein [Mycobacterium tuberculosis]|uniref:Uncharacterized protein n=1 Tax=Mycobacterium tuberculosis TaxID=1773 RepID=A0A916L9D0_MYCTX|nr:Uncharacterised protein [Mycobacterium tuberculosis]
MLGQSGEQVVMLEIQCNQANRQRQFTEHPSDRLGLAGDVDRQVDLEYRHPHSSRQPVGTGVQSGSEDDNRVDVAERFVEFVSDEAFTAGQIGP